METETTNNPTETTGTPEREETFSERHARERAEESAALALVKAGDTVYIARGYGQLAPVTVTRVADASIFIGSTAFKRANGEGRTRWSRNSIYPALPRIVERYETQERERLQKEHAIRYADHLREDQKSYCRHDCVTHHIGSYAILQWATEFNEGGYRFRLYGKNEDDVYKRINAMQGYTSLADALAVLAGAIVTTDAERLALVRLIVGN